ncbi:hypothetical protein HNP46_002196 [Pseudomonas nitritireducens]|uniref:Uncharacterized protein n=1 Tax=Pseudomonas nitroreducens TaxID=46680 RepID=A0A7W7KJ76_PSENT|nr:phage tail protein [Pseudomonas nitritireducens]MBB4863349.1 hypothetical protein [Pseudomonas nitritireducens]
MTTISDLQLLTVEALTGKTAAAARVYYARTWPTWNGLYPMLYLHAPTEDMESLGRNGAPQFTVTVTIRISARVAVKHQPNNAGAVAAQVALEQLQEQIKRAVINYTPLMRQLQQFPFVRSEFKENGDGGDEVAELVVDIGMEFYQGPEDFCPVDLDELQQLTITDDLTNVVDPTGTYPNPPFPDAVEPAPRTVGPDGRAEGGISIDFTP